MKKAVQCNSGKKGLSALDNIIGIILSVIALFFIVQLLMHLVYQGPTNEKIAKDNARSIKEFVDYSYNEYKGSLECYTMLKLSNLENFQIENNENGGGKSYFYVINEEGVWVYDMSYYINFLEGKAEFLNKNKPVYFAKFDTNNKILRMEDLSFFNKLSDGIDKTNKVLDEYILFGVLDSMGFFDETDNIKDFYSKLELKDSKYIVLRPVFSKSFFGFDVSFISSGQNILAAMSIERIPTSLKDEGLKIQNSMLYNSHYLVFKPSEMIFPSYTLDGENFIKKHLCEVERFAEIGLDKKFSSKEEYSEMINNNKVIVGVVNGIEYKFVWKINGYECYENKVLIDCGSLLKGNFGKDYDSFKESINGNFFDKFKGNGNSVEIKEMNEEKSYQDFLNSLFIEFDFKDRNGNSRVVSISDFGLNGDMGMFKDSDNFAVFKLKGAMMSFFSSSYLNGCNEEVCNYLIYDKNSGVVYFYENEVYKNFVRFDSSLISKSYDDKGKIEFYFDNKLVSYDVLSVDKDWTIFGDNLFYKVKLDYKGKEYFVLISKTQLNGMGGYEK